MSEWTPNATDFHLREYPSADGGYGFQVEWKNAFIEDEDDHALGVVFFPTFEEAAAFGKALLWAVHVLDGELEEDDPDA